MKWEKEKDKWYEWFLDNMHQVFDPLTEVSKRIDKEKGERDAKVYHIET